MNADEFGNILRLNVNEDISSNTNILELTSPDPVHTKKNITVADGLSVGTQDVITPNDGTFKADEYVAYTLQQGDIFIPGEWRARLFSENAGDATGKTTKNDIFFTVDP